MKTSVCDITRHREGGGAAVELAVILPILALMLAVPLFLARFCWHYTVAQKAAHDAANFISRVDMTDMTTLDADGRVASAVLAEKIAEMETAELNPGGIRTPITVLCEFKVRASAPPTWNACNSQYKPLRVKVSLGMTVEDQLLPFLTWDVGSGFEVWAEATMHYVGS